MPEIDLTDVTRPTAGGCCGGACSCGSAAERAVEAADQRFGVTGMTCGHCVASVQEELGALPGVEAVDVRLQPGGTSSVAVRGSRPLGVAEVRAAVEDAGYALADA